MGPERIPSPWGAVENKPHRHEGEEENLPELEASCWLTRGSPHYSPFLSTIQFEFLIERFFRRSKVLSYVQSQASVGRGLRLNPNPFSYSWSLPYGKPTCN
jgi:hypothetical protein